MVNINDYGICSSLCCSIEVQFYVNRIYIYENIIIGK